MLQQHLSREHPVSPQSGLSLARNVAALRSTSLDAGVSRAGSSACDKSICGVNTSVSHTWHLHTHLPGPLTLGRGKLRPREGWSPPGPHGS